MAKKKVSTVLGGSRHPRFKLVMRIQDLTRRIEYAMRGCSASPVRADKSQKALDEAIAEYLAWAPMQNVAYVKKRAREEAAKKAAARAALRERERAAKKKRAAAARAKAKREKLKAKKAALRAKKAAQKAALSVPRLNPADAASTVH